MPRILRIHNRLVIGGPLLNASYLTKYMPAEFETRLVVGQKEDHEKDGSFLTKQLGIEPEFIPEMGRSLSPMNDYKAYLKLKKIIADYKPDIVHTHAAKPGLLGRMAAHAMKVPVVVHTFHGHVFHSYFNKFKTGLVIQTERFLAKRSDGIVAISELQKKELADQFRIAKPEKFRVIPLGLDLDKFRESGSEKRSSFRNEFSIADDEVVIAIIGRLVPIKNHSLFLRGIAHVLQHTTQKVRAIIVGDGDMRSSIEAEATALGIGFSTEKNEQHTQPLIFTSWRSDIDRIVAGSDIIALTSFNEGTPVSLIEAQAAGKPVVSTRVGGIGDILLENETALLSDVDDPGSFFANLLTITEDTGLRTQMGAKGTGLVIEKYSYQRLMKDMAAFYYELLQKKKK